MLYSKPTSHAQEKFYARFAGVMTAHTVARRFVQYLIWFPLSSVALAVLVQQTVAKFFEPPFWTIFILCSIDVFFLHKLMSSGYKAHLFNKWDDDPDTNSSLWLYVGIGILLALLEWKTTANFFQANIEAPTLAKVEDVDAKRINRENQIKEEYLLSKSQIEENAAKQEELAAPSTFAEIRKLQETQPKTRADREYIKNRLATLDKQLAAYPTIRDIRKETSRRLDEAIVKQQRALNQLGKNYEGEVNDVAILNSSAQADYEASMNSANRYAGVVSVVSLFVFLVCAWWEVRIKTKSGIFPIRQFTDLKAHGDVFEKGALAMSDVLARWFHQLFYSIHKSGSETAGQLRGFDGEVLMQDGNYQRSVLPKQMNGHRYPIEEVGKN